ncbi:MAG TPA: POTRA domain-containing protein [Candidatus Acidoferrum sp.]|jgi:outer membrane protein assembly factor BamA
MRLRQFLSVAFLLIAPTAYGQTSALREVHADGMKILNEAQVVELTGLTTGSQVGKQDLQEAADILTRSGLFAKVGYNFTTKNDAVIVTFHVEENPRLPVTYDDFPWFADSELNDAIKKDLPFYNGTLPAAGTVVDRAANSVSAFLAEHGTTASVEHAVVANPLGEGSIQQLSIAADPPRIASVEFSDGNLTGNRAVQQHLPEIVGKPYSRVAIDLFLAESIRPVYLQQGNLRPKIGPSEVRLSGNPNQKLPDKIPVFVPCTPGPVYQWKSVEWKGNSVLSTMTLTNALGMKAGDVADGMKIEGGMDRAKEEYGHLGYLDAKLDAEAKFDDTAHTVAYFVSVSEGQQYRFNAMTITGTSLAAERIIRDAWPEKSGDVFDKATFEQLLTRLEAHRETVFKDLPIHYDTVGHWLQTDPGKGTVDVLLDFK